MAFEDANEKDPKVLEAFTQTLFAIRERHANTVPIMAEAVMEVKRNYGNFFLLFQCFGCFLKSFSLMLTDWFARKNSRRHGYIYAIVL